MSTGSSNAGGSIVMELLDSATGIPLQTWTFPAKKRLLIGRSDESDVVIANPYVSRTHAYLEWDADGYQVIAVSSQQLVFSGKRQQAIRLRDGAIFRLGPQGCDLKFREVKAHAESFDPKQTLMFDPDDGPILHLDRDQLQRDVAKIETGEYFQSLSQVVQKMKQSRRST